MGSLVDGDVLAAFAVIAEPKDVAEKLMARCAGVHDRVSFNAPWIDEKLMLDVRDQLKALLQR